MISHGCRCFPGGEEGQGWKGECRRERSEDGRKRRNGGQPESLTQPPRPNSENSTQVNLKTTDQSKKSLQPHPQIKEATPLQPRGPAASAAALLKAQMVIWRFSRVNVKPKEAEVANGGPGGAEKMEGTCQLQTLRGKVKQ